MIDLTVAADVWGPVLPLVLLALTFLVEVVWRPGHALWKRLTRRRESLRAREVSVLAHAPATKV